MKRKTNNRIVDPVILLGENEEYKEKFFDELLQANYNRKRLEQIHK